MCDPDECGGCLRANDSRVIGYVEAVDENDAKRVRVRLESPVRPTTRLGVAHVHIDGLIALYLNNTLPFEKFREDMNEIVTYFGLHKHEINEPLPPGFVPDVLGGLDHHSV